jgi:hypothetical protein
VILVPAGTVEVRVTVALDDITEHPPVILLEQVELCRVSSAGNCTVKKLPEMRLLMVVNVMVAVLKAFTEVLLTDTAAVDMTLALALIVRVIVSITYTLPLILVSVLTMMLAGLVEVG